MNFLIHLSGVNSKAKMLPMIEHNCSSNSLYCKLSDWYSYPISCSENIPIYYIYGNWNYILSAEYMCIYTHTHTYMHTYIPICLGQWEWVFTRICNGSVCSLAFTMGVKVHRYLVAALFITSKSWKQPRCSSVEWINSGTSR